MPWLRVHATVPEEQADAAEARFLAAGAAAVSLFPGSPPNTDAVIEPAPGTTPLWSYVRLEALLPLDTDPLLLQGLGHDADFLADDDWPEAWRQGQVPLRFGSLAVLPRDHDAQVTGPSIRLDPGVAFGTGTHATTALCLQWLANQRLAGKRVLDVGSGSGILSIAASRLGAAAVVAVDHDPQARLATRANATENGFSIPVLEDLHQVDGEFDIVLANIVANTLKDMAPPLSLIGKCVVLSGILVSQVDDLQASYPSFDFRSAETRPDSASSPGAETWAMLVGVRRS